MFLTSAIAWIIIVAEFVFGCFVGLLVAAILRRSNLPFGVATRAASQASPYYSQLVSKTDMRPPSDRQERFFL
jgi:multisubunit Na+/H+ antiporter MnhE subunit